MLYDEIKQKKKELKHLKEHFEEQRNAVLKLKKGQTIYTQEGGGQLDSHEYYPVVVKKIDAKKGRVQVFMGSKRWIENFVTDLQCGS